MDEGGAAISNAAPTSGALMSTVKPENRQAVDNARKFINSLGEEYIDEKALEIAGQRDQPKRIEAEADRLVAELVRIGCSPLLIRYARSAFVISLVEKCKLAQTGGPKCQSR
jgi:hypothetical protein